MNEKLDKNRVNNDDYRRLIGITVMSWLAMLGVDFLIHGGILGELYARSSPFLLSPEDAFRLIPVGYMAFLLMAILILWLMRWLQVQGGRSGFIFGLKVGALTWGALILGLLSISTAEPLLLFGFNMLPIPPLDGFHIMGSLVDLIF